MFLTPYSLHRNITARRRRFYEVFDVCIIAYSLFIHCDLHLCVLLLSQPVGPSQSEKVG